MLNLLTAVEQRVSAGAATNKGKTEWLMTGGGFVICYVVSLRSTEGLLFNLEACFIEHYDKDRIMAQQAAKLKESVWDI
jgi:hypothetical protein